MKKYELMVLLSSDLTRAEQDEILSEVKEKLEEIIFEDIWGERELAYPIKKQVKGFYAVYNSISNPVRLKELDLSLRHNAGVLRHLLISIPAEYQPITSAEVEAGLERLAQQKAKARDERHGGPKRRKQAEDDLPATKKRKEEPKEEKEPAPKPSPEKKSVAPQKEAVERPEDEKRRPEKPGKKKTSLEELDEKLDKMFDDEDMNLGF